MDSQWIVTIVAVLSAFTVIGAGGAFRYFRLLTHEADESLLHLVVRVLLPCLIFDKVTQSTAFADTSNIWLPPLVGFSTVAVGMLVALAVSRLSKNWTGLLTRKSWMTFAACVGIFNYGFIPIPLISALFEQQVTTESGAVVTTNPTLGVLFVYDQGVELAIWTLGLLLISGKLGRSWWRQMINPPSVTIVLALAINLLDLNGYVPSFLASAISTLGQAAIPMSMTLVGATIAEELQGRGFFERETGPTTKTAAWGCLLRLGVLPPLFILVAKFLPGASVELQRVMVVQAAMPSAVFPIVMARHYGGDASTALNTVLTNSFLAIATIPLWIVWGLEWIG